MYFRSPGVVFSEHFYGDPELHFLSPKVVFLKPLNCTFGALFAKAPKILLIDSEPEAKRSHRVSGLPLTSNA